MAERNPYASPDLPKVSDTSLPELRPPTSVRYSLQADDYLAWMNHLNRSNETVRRLLWRYTIGWMVAGGVLFAASFAFGPNGVDIKPLEGLTRITGIFLAVLGVLRAPLARWKSRRQVARSIRLGLYGEIDKPATATLEDRGLRLRDADGEGLRYWPGVQRVAQTEDYLFIYLQATTAAILPLRVFQSEEHFRAFGKLAERLWQEAQAPQSETAELA